MGLQQVIFRLVTSTVAALWHAKTLRHTHTENPCCPNFCTYTKHSQACERRLNRDANRDVEKDSDVEGGGETE